MTSQISPTKKRSRLKLCGWLLLPLLLASDLLAADPYAEIRTLSFGKSTEAVAAIQAEITAANPDQLRAIEKKLMAVLQAPEATPDAKSWVCRTLRLAGSEQCVPAVVPLLADARLGPDAQYALRSIPGAKVDEALRVALPGTSGVLKAGIIQTLGARGDRKAVGAIAPLAKDGDAQVAEAALYALGHIGGPEALKALENLKPAPALERYREHAILVCAESLLSGAKGKDAAQAGVELYRTSKSPLTKAAALRLVVSAEPEAAAPLLEEALRSEDVSLRSAGIRLLCEAAPEKLVVATLGKFDSWPPATQRGVMGMITNRAAVPVARKAAGTADPVLRVAALEALGRLGTAEDVPLLLERAAGGEPGQGAAARGSLLKLRDPAANDALLKAASAGAAPVRGAAVAALGGRGYAAAVPALLRLAADQDESVRAASRKALGQLATGKDLQPLVSLLTESATGPDREAAENALAQAIERGVEGGPASAALAQSLSGANTAAKCALLRLLARLPNGTSLQAMRAAQASREPSVQETAVRCLAEWPNAGAAPDLLTIARTGGDAKLRALALRGFIRLAALPSAQGPEQQVRQLGEALALGASADDTRAVLARLAEVNHRAALDLATQCLAKPEVELEAANTTVRLAKKLQATDPEASAAAIQKVLDTCKSAGARQLAENSGIILGGMINIAPQGTASSPDGLEKDGEAGGDQAAIDGNPATYWDETDGAKLYRLVVRFPHPEKIAALSVMGYEQHNFAPKDFEVIGDGKLIKTVTGAQYTDNLLVLSVPETTCQEVELKITGYYGASPAIRELGIYRKKAAAATTGPRVLVFSKTLGFRHANIPLGVQAMAQLGNDHGFSVDAAEDSGVFTAENLRRYKAVVFLSVTGDVLNPEQEKAFEGYVLGGGGFAAIHGALFGPSACEDKWAWYGELCCASFKNHSAVVPATVTIEDPAHPSTAGLPSAWKRTDEWYNYDGTPRGRAHVLATVEESSYQGGAVGPDHPIAWCKAAGKGLVWYTALGHTDESFREPEFLKHILGGIQFVSGMKPGDSAINQRPARVHAN
jgi:HEAT repeat protein/type 1 glutamine amidotransferase